MKRENQYFSEIREGQMPRHIAIVMDGNGRWAAQRGLPRTAGHQQGVKTMKDIIEACGDLGISILTVYAFSTENWRRPGREVQFIMKLFQKTIKEERENLVANGIKVNFLGRRDGLAKSLLAEMDKVRKATAENTDSILNIAFNYGSRAEILDATRKLCQEWRQGRRDLDAIDEEIFSSYLYTAGMPDVELLIRPGGEYRLSNFMLWQSAYAELYFTEIFWPDFTAKDLAEAIADFQRRERRFGGLKNCVEE